MALGQIKATIQIGVADFESKMKKAGKSLDDFGNKLGKQGEALKDLGSNFAGISASLGVIGAVAVKEFGNFETALAKVSTIADTSKVSMSDMEKAIVDTSNSIGVASKDVAEAVYDAISSGVDTAGAVDFVTKANKLAVAGFTDVGKATDVLTTVVNAYGMELKDVEKVSDVLMMTQNAGKTTVDELSASLGKAIPIANANSVQFEQVGSAMAIATARGIATSEATTYLSAMMKELGQSSSKVAKAIKEKTGKSFKDLMDEGASLTDVLGVVEDIAKDSGVGLNELFGSAEAGTMALTLMSDGGEQFNKTLDDMNKASGITNDGFEKMNETMEKKMKKAMVSVQNAMIQVGGTLAPVIQTIADKVTVMAKAFSNLPSGVQTAIVVLGVIAGVIPLIAMAIGSVLSIIPPLITGIKAVGTAFMFLATNPIGLIISAIAGVVVAGVLLYTHWDEVKAYCLKIWGAIKDFFQVVWNGIKSIISTACGWIKTYYTTMFNAYKTIIETVMNTIKTVIQTVWNVIKTTIQTVLNTIKSIITTIWNGIKTVSTTVWNGIKSVIMSIVGGISSGIESAWTKVKTVTTSIFNAIKTTVMGIWNGIGSGIQGVVNGIISVINSMIGGMNKLSFDVPDWIPEIGGKSFGFNIPTIPKVSWFETGGIFTGASVIGVGENGDEAVVPLSNKTRMKPFAQAVASMIGSDSGQGSSITNQFTINGLTVREEADVEKIAKSLYRLQQRNARAKGVVLGV